MPLPLSSEIVNAAAVFLAHSAAVTDTAARCGGRAPRVQVLDAAQQLHRAAARVGLAVRAPRQHRVQQLAAQQQLRDEVHLGIR